MNNSTTSKQELREILYELVYDVDSDHGTMTLDKGLDIAELKIKELIESGKQEERAKTKKQVDLLKEDIRHLGKLGTLKLNGESLDLISKYQAINLINLGGLPYTPYEEIKDLKDKT